MPEGRKSGINGGDSIPETSGLIASPLNEQSSDLLLSCVAHHASIVEEADASAIREPSVRRSV